MDVGGDDSSDDESRLPVPATASSSSAAAAQSPSKKALQRQRQKLRKKASNLHLNGTDSDVSAVSPNQDAPVPPISAPLQATNGSESEEQHRQLVEPEEKSFADVVKEDRDNQPEGTKSVAAPPAVPASVTTDGESADEYGGEEDDDDSSSDEEEEDVSQQQQQPVAAVKEAVESVLPALSSRPQPSSSSAQQSQSQPPTTQAYTGADHDPNKKLKAVLQRTVWGVVMAAGAIGLVCMGHVYVIALVFIIQAVVFKELTALFDAGYAHPPHSAGAEGETKVSTRTPEREAKRKGRKEERERWSRKMAWCVGPRLSFPSRQSRALY